MIMRQPAEDVEIERRHHPGRQHGHLPHRRGQPRPATKYTDPDRFDIFRDGPRRTATAFSAAADHLAFALGRHFCVGALLAKAEVEIGVGQLLDALEDIELLEEPHAEGVFTRAPTSLKVRFRPTS